MKNKAREFCEKVGELASEYGLNVFVVTDGASMTKNDGSNNCVSLHRQFQIDWEIENGFDPNDDWKK